MPGKVFLIPTVLSEEEAALQTIPAYILEAVKQCEVFFVENEKTARRFLKKIWKEMVIDDYKWYAIHKAEQEVKTQFVHLLNNQPHNKPDSYKTRCASPAFDYFDRVV